MANRTKEEIVAALRELIEAALPESQPISQSSLMIEFGEFAMLICECGAKERLLLLEGYSIESYVEELGHLEHKWRIESEESVVKIGAHSFYKEE